MHITCLPEEVLSQILFYAAKANEADGPTFSYGLTEVSATSLLEPHKARPAKYVRGYHSTQDLRWHSSSAIRQVCASWHAWGLKYSLEHLMIQMWRGEERWLELPRHIKQYSSYEIMPRQLGHVVWCPGHTSIQVTDKLLMTHPSIGSNIRRLWFNGLHLAKTDKQIMSIVAECSELRFLSAPWTILRRGTPQEWRKLLKADTSSPLHSLELQSVCLRAYKAEALEQETAEISPLEDPMVDFSQLKRLKIFGNTLTKPINDQDLALIARTATGLESIDISNNSTTTLAGLLTLANASRSTLQVLEHSPRSSDGFFHPHPGNLPADQHLCATISSLPRMRDLSLSVPYLCHEFFTNTNVAWTGECQVRTSNLCSCAEGPAGSAPRAAELRRILSSARTLIAERARLRGRLSLELFFDHCIFDPEKRVVHGDFVLAQISSQGQWPGRHESSTKGPYGASGTYGKNDGPWEVVTEEEFFAAVEKGWISL
ncbi:uncharacterized protein K489DRAFT_391439 [Dissoconium aciculare CBS 342.82]|uniref:RNI-like protein n=1 Tax=Dissoconium aciculare CBS 342.82 TaxID=1314786 RepID=A0A6J3LRR4_9PEZI|nr:uncharacterized protein K489DRAFT_391439 [Dissoconium aciculare CBS 342.82]KAF1817969.1 hypothetical protein K489DRAFT_391439 [Dissoconium aciculare CBS 342.82]